MRRNINQETIEGRLYDHDLTIKTVANQASKNFGKNFISGSVSIATDEAGLNVLTVHYTFITETTGSGKADSRWPILNKIMTENKTWLNVGKDEAVMVRATPSGALNDFYPNGGDELVSQQRNEGGFISFVSELKNDDIQRRKFTFDAVITGVSLVESTSEGNEDYARINCGIFDFRNTLLPFTLVARDPNAINYFMNLGASKKEPVYTQVWGEIMNTTIKVEKTIESAFGTPSVDVSERHQREWVVTGAKPEPYNFGEEGVMTVEELSKAIADRNVYLETVKSRAKEYYETRGNAVTPAPAPAPAAQIPTGQFNF